MPLTRRQTLGILVGSAATFWLRSRPAVDEGEPLEIYKLPPLPYNYDALEPVIDAETMHLHHDKHHGAYVKTLNKALAPYRQWHGLPIEDLLRHIRQLPTAIQQTVRNHGGGHANHSLFWQSMAPNGGGEPTGDLATAIAATFGSFSEFQAQFQQAGLKHFGSGWVWLVLTPQGNLTITTTLNQDSPLMQGHVPILGNDLWEHAYYLTYRNRRDQYLEAWWQVVNWPWLSDRYAQMRALLA
ncbi:MAG: superoxide dismutase [Thermosynechococcus sp. Uc]|uniref:superoxide dismutase n=1 Tax=Thermosynechococcus sp. Uc TaxID=3034853 RepID=UPI00259FC7DF|nr:superoxide dismutase [Thermosynechococcus sp. Uc]MDM7325876.1 superoxide dismutase [Thermosynechococcus sp. Uc]